MGLDKWTENLFEKEQEQDKSNKNIPSEEPKSLETGLQDLETIVKTLEQKDLPLEKALSLFKEGVGLVQYCSNVLDQAEKQMEILLEGPDGQLQIKPASFDVEG
ncbi:exodeoxyribonuclease VII small subunit [Desulfosporosinus youngiae]|uniref:Exodeoxyribonuclease 7 small subunit n=1 Tax=Desulfosporosinus youngiae DSM 17734 TaxID=768710 RepID=H5XSL0_9FIRM|nr:exodeoxyribonuclease VII small subunit [Desulfosporosinus youngiae]EHQ88110.1 exonuclease VII small subunit [Desulfosporosinus youngiae DSM 17734]